MDRLCSYSMWRSCCYPFNLLMGCIKPFFSIMVNWTISLQPATAVLGAGSKASFKRIRIKKGSHKIFFFFKEWSDHLWLRNIWEERLKNWKTSYVEYFDKWIYPVPVSLMIYYLFKLGGYLWVISNISYKKSSLISALTMKIGQDFFDILFFLCTDPDKSIHIWIRNIFAT